MLDLSNIVTMYGRAEILHGISLHVGAGEMVALMGRNGMGKSTLMRSIIGLTPPARGRITFGGQMVNNLPPYQIARLGIGYVPENREIFPSLTVRENMEAVAADYGRVADPYTPERVLSIFPRLRERINHQGRELSGGEQQMLAIGRALVINPLLLLLDEATEGLAPILCEEIWQGLALLKRRSMAILMADRNIDAMLAISDRCLILEKGRVVWQAEKPFSAFTDKVRCRYLGV